MSFVGTKAHQNLRSCRNVGLLGGALPGLKILGGLQFDYEYYAVTAVAMVQVAFCKIMLNKHFG